MVFIIVNYNRPAKNLDHKSKMKATIKT